MTTAATGPLLVGIDLGSQSAKVVVHDAAGAVVAQGRRSLRATLSPRPGAVEHPEDDLWDALGAATRQAMDAVVAGGRSPEDLVGLGLCGIRNTRALVRADGSPAAPVISWMDERVARPHERETEPAGVRWITASSGYLTLRLTGRAADSAAADQGHWPLDPDRWDWPGTDAGQAADDAERERLVELVLPGAVIGGVTEEAAAHTGLPAGLPVVATANDKAVEALGTGLREPGDVLISLGTYAAGMVVGDERRPSTGASWSNLASVPGRYLHESAGIRRGMWTVSWLRDLVGRGVGAPGDGPAALEDALNAAAALVPPGAHGLLTVPEWLAPPGAPHRRGSIVGLDGRHGPAHLWRSLLEGMALTLYAHVSALAATHDLVLQRVLLSGGGARSPLMQQVVADVAGLPVVLPSAVSGAALGSAVCAAVGTGIHASFDAAVAAMVHPGEVVEADPSTRATYDALGRVLHDLSVGLDPVLRRLAAAVD